MSAKRDRAPDADSEEGRAVKVARTGIAGRGGDEAKGAEEALTLPPSSFDLQKFHPDAGAVRLLGDPVLRQKSRSVNPLAEDVVGARQKLEATLVAFRKKWGFGRGISAVQIGIPMRMISLNLGDERGEFTLHNPEITWRSKDTFTLYDDCMSFPDLLVKVRRHKSITVAYRDENDKAVTMSRLPQDVSELLQHEMDHLDGRLAVDIGESIVLRSMYEANKDFYDAQVDYAITPTI